MTQNDRVGRMLRRAGRHGISQTDFDGPHTADGGPPVRRLASRIADVRALGYEIDSTGRRNRMAVYRLISEPGRVADPVASPAGDAAPGALFEAPAPKPRSAIFGDDV